MNRSNLITIQNKNNINLNKNNCLQPLQIPDVEHELVRYIPPPCASAKSNTNRSMLRKLEKLFLSYIQPLLDPYGILYA